MSDIAFRDESQIALYTDENWGQSGYTIAGADFDIEKAWLVGVPHVITALSYRLGDMNPAGFVTCEATIAPQGILNRALRRSKIKVLGPDGAPMVEAEEVVGYNDGSTGIRRQTVKLLEDFGLIKIKSKLPPNGPMGESRYDLNYTHWEWDSKQSKQEGDSVIPHFTHMHNGQPFSLTIMGGLRDSDGGNRPKDSQPTYYLS